MESLIKIYNDFKEISENNDYAHPIWVRISEIIDECTELDPWLPIDESAPKDRKLLLYASYTAEKWIGFKSSTTGNSYIMPTHYKELPEDPK